jgi:hypothetical protein
MKLNVRQKTPKKIVSFRLEENTIKFIKAIAKENNSSESAVLDELVKIAIKRRG